MRRQIAHHEAAHAIAGIWYGMGISGGIDLDASTSVAGAQGNVGVNLFLPDDALPDALQRQDLMRNLAVICAGAASDARLTGRSLEEAIAAQPGDRQAARDLIRTHPLVEAEPDDQVDELVGLLLERAMMMAARLLAKDEVWCVVEEVAASCLSAGGTISKADIETIAANYSLGQTPSTAPD